MITARNITKTFGDFVAVDNLSFDIKPGDVVGFLGPNGAGKSTTMKMLTGFLSPDAGRIMMSNLDIQRDQHAIAQRIGYLPEGAPAYGDMTPLQMLNFIADVRGLRGEYKQQRLSEVIAQVQLQSVLDKPIDNLSKGFKRRVGLAQAIIHDPEILILDEPTDGLDPNQKHQVRALIKNLSQDKIVIISTHILEEVTAVCNRAMIIAAGKKLFDDTPAVLQQRSRFHQAVTVQFASLPATEPFMQIPEVAEVIVDHSTHAVTLIPVASDDKTVVADSRSLAGNLAGNVLLQQVNQFLEREQLPALAVFVEQGRLDDVFRDLTEGRAA